jgi:hypothetical protein
MRRHLLVPSCVVGLVLSLAPADSSAGRTAPGFAGGIIPSQIDTLTPVPEPDGIWVAVIAVAALAASRPTGGRRGR